MHPVPALPDDVLRLVHYFYAADKARATAKRLHLRQHETGTITERRIGYGLGWSDGLSVTLVRGSVELTAVPDPRYNFTVVPHPCGVGILESNSGEGFGSLPPSLEPFVGVLPWGVPDTRWFCHGGWSRSTRSVRVAVPVWRVPRAWGFEGHKAFFSKVIVTESETERPPVDEGIVDPWIDASEIVTLEHVPDDTRVARCL